MYEYNHLNDIKPNLVIKRFLLLFNVFHTLTQTVWSKTVYWLVHSITASVYKKQHPRSFENTKYLSVSKQNKLQSKGHT